MPQTREHLAIAEQLGVSRGIPVITKTDLVDPEWADIVCLEVAEWLSRSTIDFEPPILVSATKSSGLDQLRSAIGKAAAEIVRRDPGDLFRLPVDRSFSVAGTGTVVTGTGWSGTIAPGDRVQLMPSRREARVRSVEIHGKPVDRSVPGRRVALGLAGIDREEVHRGDVVVQASGGWEPTQALDVLIRLLPDTRPLVLRSRVRLHLGTAEVLARVHPRGPLHPGEVGTARLALEAPTIARAGDRFVLRSYSPVVTIGGGEILDPIPPRRRALWPAGLGHPRREDRIQALWARRPHGVHQGQLALFTGLPSDAAAELMREADAYRLAGDRWVSQSVVDDLATTVTARLEEFHRTRPSDPGMSLSELRESLRSAPWIVTAALADLERGGKLASHDGLVRLAGFTPSVTGGNAQVQLVVATIEKAGLMPPSTAELAVSLGIADLLPTLRLAAADGLVEPVERDRYYSRSSLETFRKTIRAVAAEGEITPGQLRDRLGISRKYLIPLLEWADRQGITVRAGEGRRLKD